MDAIFYNNTNFNALWNNANDTEMWVNRRKQLNEIKYKDQPKKKHERLTCIATDIIPKCRIIIRNQVNENRTEMLCIKENVVKILKRRNIMGTNKKNSL